MKWLFKFAPLFVILGLSFLAWKPLLISGYFSMHDDQQIARLFEMNKAIISGQFPVRWVSGLGFGYGYALFNFYPPLVYYLGEIYHAVLGVGFIDSTKLVWFTALAGSGIAMYFLAREFFGKWGGVVSAVFYIYAPYHAVDAYVRGALAELFSFVWLPLILFSLYKITIQENRRAGIRWAILSGIFLGLLMVTHNLIFLPFMPIAVIWYFLMWLIYCRRRVVLTTFYFTLAVTVAFSLTAFFWLPALLEKQYTLVDQILIKNLASYKIHFVCPSQLWNSPWGYGGSVAGCVDGISFMIGKVHLLGVLGGVLIAGYMFLKKKYRPAFLLSAGVGFFLFSAFMTTNLSAVIWDKLSPLWYLQFPWRFMEFVVLFGSFLAGSLGIISFLSGRLKMILSIVLVGGVILINAKYFQPQQYLTTVSDNSLITDKYLKWDISSTSFEFMPKGVETYINSNGVVWPRIAEYQVSSIKYQVLRGDFRETRAEFLPGNFVIDGISGSGVKIEVQQTNFPGWKVWIDETETDISDNNPYKLITISVPEGKHKISGRFTNTLPRQAGNLIFLGSIILVSGYLLYGTRRSKA